MSGHSKWANIKHRKGRQDAKRGKIFTRLGKEITIAAREGGGDPTANPRLRLAMQNARAANMPQDNIQRAVKRGTGEIAGVTYEEYTYEGYAPNAVAVILETVTDNKNRTIAEIRSMFGKLGGNMGDTNSVAWNFDRKGTLKIKTNGKTEDEMLELVLESGAEDLEFDEEITSIITAFDSFGEVNRWFESNSIEIEEAKVEYMPKTMVKIENPVDAKKVIKFIESFEDHEDVQNVYSNFEIDDELLEQIENMG